MKQVKLRLREDCVSAYKRNGKRIVYGLKGEIVTLVADHFDVLVVEGKSGRFAVLLEKVEVAEDSSERGNAYQS